MPSSGFPLDPRISRGLYFLWGIGIVAGVVALDRIDLRAAGPATPPAAWPNESLLPRNELQTTLVLFAHPKCPCTRASLSELKRFLSRSRAKCAVIVVFIQPVGMSDEWTRGSLWEWAKEIPGAICVADKGLREATLFNATTSGQVLLYDANGRLIYAGGITIARGYEGTNPGVTAIGNLLAARPAQVINAPVFGCPLFNAENTCRLKGSSCQSP